MTDRTRGARESKFAIGLDELEASAHVALADQVVEQPGTPRSESPVAPEDLDRMRLLGITGAGRLDVR